MQKTPHTTTATFATCSDEDLQIEIWETYYFLVGLKPRHYRMSEWTREDLLTEVVSLNNQWIDQCNWEAERKHLKMLEANKEANRRRKFDSSFNSLTVAFTF